MGGMRWMIASGLMALSACGQGGGEDAAARDQIRIVGSSTVYPYTTAVAEAFARKNTDFPAPMVEQNGTGAGVKLFCAGVGPRFPDIVDASRRLKPSEYQECAKNGVDKIIEVQIGIDGIVLAQSLQGPSLSLTEEDVYNALAAQPHGRPQRSQTWRNLGADLPATRISVYGPPPTSGTRDAFVELVLQKGCDADPAMAAIERADPDKARTICTKIREDGAFIESGENDNLIVQKLAANPESIGIFGFGFLEENRDRVRGIALQGVAPNQETIANATYPGARPLYIYVKAAHLDAVPGLRAFVAEYANDGTWGPNGYLVRRGLIPSPTGPRATAAMTAKRLQPLDPGTLR
jgi:phosphate transport system substrate-binding protein